MTRANNWDRWDEFPGGWLPSNHSTYGVCERKHAISNTTKEKNHTLKDRESEGATARLRNGKWGARKHVSNSGHWLVCIVRYGTILLKPHIGTVYSSSAQFPPPPPPPLMCKTPTRPLFFSFGPLPPPPPQPTYWVLTIQKMSGSRGSPCTILYISVFESNKQLPYLIIANNVILDSKNTACLFRVQVYVITGFTLNRLKHKYNRYKNKQILGVKSKK